MPRRFDKDKEKPKRGAANRFGPQKKKTCKFCANKELKLDYKNPQQMSIFLSERGKILPRRFTGACSKHQRDITLAVKRARILAVVPFTATQVR
jgi:small subunit ribosomal protein S18